MTSFPDPNLGRPLRPIEPPENDAENTADVVPPTERNLDPLRAEQSHNLTTAAVEARPADRPEPVAERVYAPASERVPKPPVPGHRDVIEHTDTHTPEREAAGMDSNEPSFTRVPRPSTANNVATTETTSSPDPYTTPLTNPGLNPGQDPRAEWGPRRQKMFMGMGFGWATVIGCGAGVWLFMRWRAERNKPINRLRRRAQQTWSRAEELRARMPVRQEAARPAAGIGTVLVPLALVLWRASQSRSRPEPIGRAERMGREADKAARRAAQTMSDVDWQKRLARLKENWNPSRLELEKIQISRH
jgi:hypothetical protein